MATVHSTLRSTLRLCKCHWAVFSRLCSTIHGQQVCSQLPNTFINIFNKYTNTTHVLKENLFMMFPKQTMKIARGKLCGILLKEDGTDCNVIWMINAINVSYDFECARCTIF